MRARIVKQKRPPTNPNVPLHASNVNWVKQQRLKGQLTVMLATLVRLAKPKVFARHARLGSIKIPKVKQHAVIPVTCQKKSPTKRVPGVNCHRGVLAKKANI